jgi:hypothetical protein
VQTMAMVGNYTPETYQMTMSIGGMGPQGKPMSMQMELNAKHNGECTGKEEK